jgi:putative N6-adenine-specific DNA methylase
MKELFISCLPNLERILIKELESLGIANIRPGFGGVFAPASLTSVYKINYCSRIATRVLWPLAQFPCIDRHALYQGARKIKWFDYLTINKTFAIDANVSHPNLRNSLFAALVLKDAICDTFREKTTLRPSVNVHSPDVQLNLFIQNGKATINFDTSGMPLFKRGWRKESGTASLQESLAAAILAIAEYQKKDVLCDPFCGSGTFLIEAAMIATHTPAGFFRKSWGFFQHPDFSAQEWNNVKNAADGQRAPLEKGKIFGADKDPKVIEQCVANLINTDFSEVIEISCKDIKSHFPSLRPSLIVSNPPYGKRLNANADIYRSLGVFVKSRCSSPLRSYILAKEENLASAMGIEISNKIDLSNGGLNTALYMCKK